MSLRALDSDPRGLRQLVVAGAVKLGPEEQRIEAVTLEPKRGSWRRREPSKEGGSDEQS